MRTVINFCVGIFIFLSGFFVNIEKIKNNRKQWIIKRLKRVGIPFFVFSILAATIKMLENHNSIFEYIVDILLGRAPSQLYYIVVLIQLIILTPFIIQIIQSRKKFINIGIILITPIYLVILAILNIKYNYQLPQYGTIFFGWILYYYLGIYYKTNKDNVNLIKYKNKKYIGILFIIINCCINLYMYKKGVRDNCVTSQLKALNMIYILFVIIIMLYFENKIKNIKLLVNLGNLSFEIYFIKIYNYIINWNNFRDNVFLF